jgi:hypothetical protein
MPTFFAGRRRGSISQHREFAQNEKLEKTGEDQKKKKTTENNIRALAPNFRLGKRE